MCADAVAMHHIPQKNCPGHVPRIPRTPRDRAANRGLLRTHRSVQLLCSREALIVHFPLSVKHPGSMENGERSSSLCRIYSFGTSGSTWHSLSNRWTCLNCYTVSFATAVSDIDHVVMTASPLLSVARHYSDSCNGCIRSRNTHLTKYCG